MDSRSASSRYDSRFSIGKLLTRTKEKDIQPSKNHTLRSATAFRFGTYFVFLHGCRYDTVKVPLCENSVDTCQRSQVLRCEEGVSHRIDTLARACRGIVRYGIGSCSYFSGPKFLHLNNTRSRKIDSKSIVQTARYRHSCLSLQ